MEKTSDSTAKLVHEGRALGAADPLTDLPTIVGSGYAARLETESGRLKGIRVVRLSDRASIFLASSARFRFSKPLSLVGGMLYALVGAGGRATLARIRLIHP
jgi:hypothetical protein